MDKVDQQKAKERDESKTGKVLHCQLCGKPSPDTICDHCKALVQAEALEKKRRAEKSRE